MNLKELNCQNNSSFDSKLSAEDKLNYKNQLDSSWIFLNKETKLERKLEFKNFKKPLQIVNLIGELAETERHHPDFQFGWGYCHITITNHQKQDLSLNDFILASKIDKILSGII